MDIVFNILVIIKRRPLALAAAGIGLVAACSVANANPGLPTRNLNPILQSIFLPTYVNSGRGDGWRVDHSLYVSNNFHQDIRANETLLIDVENYRYELGLQYRRGDWILQARLPFSANQGGKLDALIEGWHTTFGFPDGNRDSTPRDQVDIEYRRDDAVRYSQTESSGGFNDMSVAIGYQPPGKIGYFLGVDLPTGSSNLTGNESIDVAVWLLGDTSISQSLSIHGLVGVSFPGDKGALEGLLASEIWAAQIGMNYRFTEQVFAIAQVDMHSQTVEDSELKAFGQSLQLQLGLGFEGWLENHRLELFFSEDIDVGTAPDISFGLRMVQSF